MGNFGKWRQGGDFGIAGKRREGGGGICENIGHVQYKISELLCPLV